MTVSGPDISSYEGGLKIQPNTVFVFAKATEGTYYRDAYFNNFHSQSIGVGAVFSGYAFIKQEGSASAQADYYHAFAGNTPVMLDVETEGSSKPGMLEILSFMDRTKALGGRAWGVYLPRWYWQQIGSPDLTPITARGAVVISSAYDYVGGDGGPGWAPYGGVTPTVWQYTDKLNYGGFSCDFNAYKGTKDQMNALVNGGSASPQPVPKPAPGQPVVSLAVVQMAEREDPAAAQGHTTNYNNVIWVERALQAEGLLSAQYVDGSYGTLTVAAYKAWQQRLGYFGTDADGVPGMSSLSKLGGAHGFKVVA